MIDRLWYYWSVSALLLGVIGVAADLTGDQLVFGLLFGVDFVVWVTFTAKLMHGGTR